MTKNTITFITCQKGTQGSYLNHLDLQQYLKDVEGYKIKFYCENVKALFNVVKNSRRNYIFKPGEIKVLKQTIIENNVVITDFKSLIQFKERDNFIACKKLLIFDCVELSYHLKDITTARFFYDVDLYKALKCFYADKIEFLMPQNNYDIFIKKYPDLNARVFYKAINPHLLKEVSHKNTEGFFYRWDDTEEDFEKSMKLKFGDKCFSYPPTWMVNDEGKKVPMKYNEANHLFDYRAFLYRRRAYLEYEEQFGRLIFEYILLGKTVYFVGEPFTGDGLTDYLHHYNIKFKGLKIITTKEELTNKMEKYKDRPWRRDE